MPWFSKDEKELKKYANSLTNKKALKVLQSVAVDLDQMEKGTYHPASEGAYYELDFFRGILVDSILRRLSRKRKHK